LFESLQISYLEGFLSIFLLQVERTTQVKPLPNTSSL